MKILIINGPNINMLGIRNKNIYGNQNYDSLVEYIYKYAHSNNVDVEVFQSNIEGEIITKIQSAYSMYDGLIINAGGYSHTSISIMDAIDAVQLPCIDVHLSNIHSRECFRNNSYIAKVSIGQISGFGFESYVLAIQALKDYIDAEPKRIKK